METRNQTQANQTGTAPEKKDSSGLFEGLSFAQVAAGALAAVTSLLLSSRIGWGGSVIGVAVGSVVSTVSSQVYKKFFQKGADKIKDIASSDSAPKQGPSGATVMPPASPETGVAHPTVDDDAIRSATAETHRSAATGTRVVSDRLEQKVKQRKRAKVQKGVIAVSIVSAILAVIVSAGVVSCATSGQGIGSKPAPVVKVADQEGADSTASSSEASDSQATAGESGGTSGSQAASTSGSSETGGDGSNSTGGTSASKGSGTDAGSGTSASGTTGKGSNGSSGTNANGGSDSSTASSSGSADSTATSSQSTATTSEATDTASQG